MTSLSNKIKDWEKFLKKLREGADFDDPNIIVYKKFVEILKVEHIMLNEKEKDFVLQAFAANQDLNNRKISINSLFNISFVTKKV